jgi:hypothetical protein
MTNLHIQCSCRRVVEKEEQDGEEDEEDQEKEEEEEELEEEHDVGLNNPRA